MQSGSDNVERPELEFESVTVSALVSASEPGSGFIFAKHLQRLDLYLHLGIELIMKSRRSHRKSRNGCPECKARRLKV